jgi:YfiH family protein|tara:strand:+ start:236 stop:961 length:726 start_codon:yes stop_codon:yes gene_type:complete
MPIQIKPVIWEVPSNIKAFSTTRIGGFSKGEYKDSNLSLDVGDEQTHVKKNRRDIKKSLNLTMEPCWMKQIHSATIKKVKQSVSGLVCDGSYTDTVGLPCAVLSADCLPILVCNKDGTKVGVIHAGWRGLDNGIITKFIKKFSKDPSEIICWIGPSISQNNYLVREDVYKKLSTISPAIFNRIDEEHWGLDLKKAAKVFLKDAGVEKIFTDEMCTYQSANLYYSYRGETNTGRIASLIWIE